MKKSTTKKAINTVESPTYFNPTDATITSSSFLESSLVGRLNRVQVPTSFIENNYLSSVNDDFCIFKYDANLRTTIKSTSFIADYDIVKQSPKSYLAEFEMGVTAKYKIAASDNLRIFKDDNFVVRDLNNSRFSFPAGIEIGITNPTHLAQNTLIENYIPISARIETEMLTDYRIRINESVSALNNYNKIFVDDGVLNSSCFVNTNYIIENSYSMRAFAELETANKYLNNNLFANQLFTDKNTINNYFNIENNGYANVNFDSIMPINKGIPATTTLNSIRHVLEQHKTSIDNSHYGSSYEIHETEKEINITVNYYFNGNLKSTNMHFGSNITNKKLN